MQEQNSVWTFQWNSHMLFLNFRNVHIPIKWVLRTWFWVFVCCCRGKIFICMILYLYNFIWYFSKLRKKAYRSSTLFLHGRLGKGKRVVLPACAGKQMIYDQISMLTDQLLYKYHWHCCAIRVILFRPTNY